jgi:hypothetical protein
VQSTQRRAQIGLNKGEAHHALKRAISFHPRGEIRDRVGVHRGLAVSAYDTPEPRKWRNSPPIRQVWSGRSAAEDKLATLTEQFVAYISRTPDGLCGARFGRRPGTKSP